jgi:hypothetical protein
MPATTRRPVPVRLIEFIGYLGVLLWGVLIVRAALADDGTLGRVALVGILLGGAHVVIAVGAIRGSRSALVAIGFVLLADLVLALVVDPKAWILVGATVLLVVLAATPAARAWWGRPRVS